MKKQITKQKTALKSSFYALLISLLLNGFTAFSQSGATIKFDGVNDGINLGTALTTSLNGSNKITIEAWVNASTNSGGHGPIVGNFNTNNSGPFSFLLRRENGHHVFWVGNNSNSFSTVSINTSTINTWIHLAAVWNGTVANIYVNGALTASSTHTLATLQNTINQVHIGSAPLVTEYFNGMIDEVRIWNVARTQCQINTYKNCEIPNNTTGLLVNYHFNQGIAAGSNTAVTTLIDATSNAVTGTLTGISLTGTASNWVAPGGVVSGYTTALALPSYSATSLSVCQGNTISLTSTGATSFTWSPAIVNGTPFTPSASTAYTIVNNNSASSCSNTSVVNVTVTSLPTLTLSTTNTLLCTGSSATLSISGTATTYTWNTGSNSNTIIVSPTVTTNYTVTGTNSTGCVNNAVFTQSVSLCTSINSSNLTNNEVMVYPNPGKTNISLNTTSGIKEVLIYNTLGKLIKIENTSEFSVETLPIGLYIFNIRTESGTYIARFIKE